MPNKVCCALREKIKYKNQMRSRRRVGDAMLESSTVEYRKEDGSMSNFDDMEVLSVKYLKECPLTNFIHLAANECGFAGSREDLITGWIHPLFLKARAEASKDNNPTQGKAMKGDFKQDFWEAAEKEIKKLEKETGAWEVVDRTEDMNVLGSIWAFKIKRFPDGLIKKFKARFCARGDQQLE